MQIAFSSLACPGWSVEDIAAAAERYGYDGVEWRLADGALLGPDTSDDVWERIKSSGSEPVCVDTSCAFVRATDDERDTAVRDAIAMAERAAAIGASAIRVFGGRIPEGLPPDEVAGSAREALTRVTAGVPEGVRVLIETHDAWTLGADVARLVDGLKVGVLWDVAHTIRAGESSQETLDHIGVPGLVHVKDAIGAKLMHLGEGDIPLSDAVRVLRAAGYDGWLSLEWEKLWHPDLDEADVVLPKAAAVLRDLVTDGDL